jgi:cation diffusion facilitator family transporter
MLYDESHHGHAHAHDHGHHHHGADAHHHRGHHHHADQNFRAAYVHVAADALTSVLAIVALGAGRLFGWSFLDPVMGLVGTLVIMSWSVSLLRSAGAVLVDAVPDGALAARVRERLEQNGDKVSDLHLWRLGPGHTALIAAVVSDHPQAPDAYKALLSGLAGLSHVTVEVHACPDAHG